MWGGGGGQAAHRQLHPGGVSCPGWGARYPGVSSPRRASCPGGCKLPRVQDKPVHRDLQYEAEFLNFAVFKIIV